jgi:hypothetical protein
MPIAYVTPQQKPPDTIPPREWNVMTDSPEATDALRPIIDIFTRLQHLIGPSNRS